MGFLARGRRTSNAPLKVLSIWSEVLWIWGKEKGFFLPRSHGALNTWKERVPRIWGNIFFLPRWYGALNENANNAALTSTSAAGLKTWQEKNNRVYSLNHPPKGYKSKAPFFVSTTRPSWHFPVFHLWDAEDAGNARDATTQLTGTDPVFALKILRLSDTQHWNSSSKYHCTWPHPNPLTGQFQHRLKQQNTTSICKKGQIHGNHIFLMMLGDADPARPGETPPPRQRPSEQHWKNRVLDT